MVSAFELGAGWAALQRAIHYSQERVQAGAHLSQKPGYTKRRSHLPRDPGRGRLERREGQGYHRPEPHWAKHSLGLPQPLAFHTTYQAIGGNEHLFEEQRGRVAGPNTMFVLGLPCLKPGIS